MVLFSMRSVFETISMPTSLFSGSIEIDWNQYKALEMNILLTQGNDGNDSFVFNTKLGSGVPHIADFEHSHDRIVLDHDFFAGVTVGTLKAAAFAHGTRAHDASDRFIYNEDRGVLRFDADGKGGAKAHIVAVLDTAPHLTHDDIFVI
ncbi:MAG: hypothetical protein MUO41_02490 [Methyloceanibacter sp.]|nr:hypothetical protein [Methyloceanibacter sp.]